MKQTLFLCLAMVQLTGTMAQSFNFYSPNTQKPPLHGRHWMAITGKPLAATAGAITFQKGGNAVDGRLRHDSRHQHHVGRTELGRRNTGTYL